jgi:outer membrane autotransporter protein
MIVRGKGCCGPTVGGWVVGLGIGGDIDAPENDSQNDGSISDVNTAAGGLLFGVHKWMNDCSLVGVYGGYIYSEVDAGLTDTEIDNYQLGAYYRYDDGCNRLVAIGSLGFQEYASARYDSPGGMVPPSNADYDGNLYGCYLELSRGYCWDCNVVRPLFALQYLHVDQYAYTESGGSGAQTVSDVEVDSCRTFLGGRLGRQYRGPNCWLLTPQVRAMWVHELADTYSPAATSFGGPSGIITSNGVDLGRDWFMGGVGVTIQKSDAASVTVDYDLQANGRMNFHMGSLGLNLYW